MMLQLTFIAASQNAGNLMLSAMPDEYEVYRISFNPGKRGEEELEGCRVWEPGLAPRWVDVHSLVQSQQSFQWP